MTVDIGLMSYGRQKFLDLTIQSIKQSVKVPHRIYVGHCHCKDEPDMDSHIIGLTKDQIDGAIVIQGNAYSRTVDLLSQYFLKSPTVVLSDADVWAPQELGYCWLQYMSDVIAKDPDIVSLTIRPSVDNLGQTDEEVSRRSVGRFKRVVEAKAWYRAAEFWKGQDRIHPKYPLIGVGHSTGVFMQVIQRDVLDKHISDNKRFQKDSELRKTIKGLNKQFGVLLDPCTHLGWEVEDHYDYYLGHKQEIASKGYPSPYTLAYSGTPYEVYGTNRTKIASGVLAERGGVER